MTRLLAILLVTLTLCACTKEEVTSLKVMEINVWNDGKMFAGSYEGLVDAIDQIDADVILMQEVRSQNSIDTLIALLGERGKKYSGVCRTISTAIISKYPLSDVGILSELGDDSYAFTKATIEVKNQKVVLYSVHLDWLYVGYYMARGYSGTTWERLEEPMLNADSLIAYGKESRRDQEIEALIADIQRERVLGKQVIFGGDFNEPSHLDWQTNSRDIRDHGGLVVEWPSSSTLYSAGCRDTYRELYPNSISHPAFTCNAGNKDVESSHLEWALGVDDRERIDLLYYIPSESIKLKEAAIFGPKEEYFDGRIQYIKTDDNIIEPTSGVWPSDHKSTVALFEIATK